MLRFLVELARALFALLFLALVYPVSKPSSSPNPAKPSPPRKAGRAYLGACVLVLCGIVAVVDTNAPQLVLNDANSVLHEALHRQCYTKGVWHRLSAEEQRVAAKDYGFYCSFGDVLLSMVKASAWMAGTSRNPITKVAVLFALPTQAFDAAAKMLVSGKPEAEWDKSATQKYWHPRDHVYVFMLVWTAALVAGFVDKHAQVLVRFCRSSSRSWNLRGFVCEEGAAASKMPPKKVDTVPTSPPKTNPAVEKTKTGKQILWWKWE